MILNNKFCAICGEKLEKEPITVPEPVFRFYKCKHCGYYFPLEETEYYTHNWNVSLSQKLQEKIEHAKKSELYEEGYTCMIIGPKFLLDQFDETAYCKNLLERGFKIIKIEHSLLGDADD